MQQHLGSNGRVARDPKRGSYRPALTVSTARGAEPGIAAGPILALAGLPVLRH